MAILENPAGSMSAEKRWRGFRPDVLEQPSSGSVIAAGQRPAPGSLVRDAENFFRVRILGLGPWTQPLHADDFFAILGAEDVSGLPWHSAGKRHIARWRRGRSAAGRRSGGRTWSRRVSGGRWRHRQPLVHAWSGGRRQIGGRGQICAGGQRAGINASGGGSSGGVWIHHDLPGGGCDGLHIAAGLAITRRLVQVAASTPGEGTRLGLGLAGHAERGGGQDEGRAEEEHRRGHGSGGWGTVACQLFTRIGISTYRKLAPVRMTPGLISSIKCRVISSALRLRSGAIVNSGLKAIVIGVPL